MAEVYARLNHGRWLADCPICNGAELVDVTQPFVCFSCEPLARKNPLNALVKYDVIFPENWAEIDGIVKNRPEKNRNWYPGETVKDLKKENAMHGVKDDLED